MVLHATNLDLIFPKSLHEKKWLRKRITWNPCNAYITLLNFAACGAGKGATTSLMGRYWKWSAEKYVKWFNSGVTFKRINPIHGWRFIRSVNFTWWIPWMFFEGTHAETILSIHAVDRFLPKKNFRFKIFRASFDWRIWPHESKGW